MRDILVSRRIARKSSMAEKKNNLEHFAMKQWIQQVDNKLDNHLIQVGKDISQIQNDIDWIKRFFWLVAGISITAVGGAFFALILK